MSWFFRVAAAIGFVIALVGGTSGAQAAALPTSVATIKSVVPDNTISVQRRWRGGGGGGHWHGGGRGYGWRGGYGWGWGWPYYGTGVVIGASPYYYAPYYEPYYPRAVAPAPAPRSGAVRQCWVDTDSGRGYGYWRPC